MLVQRKKNEDSEKISGNVSLVAGIFLVMLIGIGCSAEGESDAYGQFEATETTVSSELAGKLIQFKVEEGDELDTGSMVGLVDTSKLVLKKEELNSQLESTRSRISTIDARLEVQKTELETANKDLNRTQALKEDKAATQQQLDDAEARVRTLQKQLAAQDTQKQSIYAEIRATKSRIAQVDDQIGDAIIINPIKGTVLSSFAEPHEMVKTGQPLYRIASMDTLILQVYMSGAQLPSVSLGQSVEVLIDKNKEENESLEGRISWIASEAEFTPRMIQTKEERVTQVYAVKIRVPNSQGKIKLGMPGEVKLKKETN